MPDHPAISIQDVHKTFRLPRERVHTLKEKALHPLRRPAFDELRALRGVSFDVAKGEFFGVVGRNGSGKSTLLKCMAGIYATDGGRILVSGRMSTFIELGVGFNLDLAARENVQLNATMLGLTPKEARRRFDEIIDFAELREFTDLKLKNYSSGMLVRLAFAVMIQVDAEILLIDEVLAVGDAAFQQKCFEEFERIKRSGTTVLLVTHDMSAVTRFCDRGLLLEHGNVVEIAEPERVGLRYLQMNFSEEARAAEASNEVISRETAPAMKSQAERDDGKQGDRMGDGSAEILDARFEDEDGHAAEVIASRSRAAFVMHVRFNEDVEDPQFRFSVHNSHRDYVFAGSTVLDDPHPGLYRAGEEVVVRFEFTAVLSPDRYSGTATVAHPGSGMDFCDHRPRISQVIISATRTAGGIANLPVDISVQRGVAERSAS